jgi:hypothetical protein
MTNAPKQISQEELDKVRPEVAKEQAVLLLNLQEVIKEALLHRPTRRGYKHFSCVTTEDPVFLHNQMFSNNFSTILNLRPYQLAMFTPKLRFYKKTLKSGEYTEISFDSFVGSGQDDPATAGANRYDPRKIMNGEAFNGSGIGIQRFEWKLSGDITDTPDKRLQTYAADLTLRMENINELFVTRTDEVGRKYSAQELFAPERGRGEEVDENQYKILVEVGWNVAEGAMANNEIYQSIGTEVLEEIKRTCVRFELSLINHDINFNQDGSISLTLSYIASLAAAAQNPLFSNLKSGMFRDQIRANVVEKAIFEASKSEDKAVKKQAEAFLRYKRTFDEEHRKLREKNSATGGMLEAAVGNITSDLLANNEEAKLAYEKMKKIYSKYEQEHRTDIDARAREAESAMNCKWIVNNLLSLNRIKLFQVQKQDVLSQQKIVKTRRVPKKSARAVYMDHGAFSASDYNYEQYVVAGHKPGIDDRYSEAIGTVGRGIAQTTSPEVDATGRLKDMLMLSTNVPIVTFTPGEDDTIDTAFIQVWKIQPKGAELPHYRVDVDEAGTLYQNTFPDDSTGRIDMADWISVYIGDNDPVMDAIEGADTYGDIELIQQHSDAVYRSTTNFIEKMRDLDEIDGKFSDTKLEKIQGVNVAGGVTKTSGLEDIDGFVADLFAHISKTRSERREDGQYLNIRYVTVGDIFDAFLMTAYGNDAALREHKFIMGPVVVNEAKGVIGDTADFTIQYSSRDADLNVVLKKTDGENSIFEQEKRKNREDRIYNLADLPISFDNLLLWVQKNITENKNPFMTFDKFVSSLLSSMLDDAYSQVGEYRQILPRANFGTEMDTFMLLDDKQRSSRYPDADIFGLMNGRHELYGPEKHPTWSSRILVDDDTSELIKDKMPKNVAYDTQIVGRKMTNYHLITSRCRFPENRLYNYTSDMAKGIPHFFVGQDSGIIKSIEFEQADVPGQLESNVLNAMAAAEESTSPAAVYLRKPYNATINMVGNPFFSRGQMLFINPSMAGVGSLGKSNSAAARIGLGGYYRVVEILNSIDASGKYETQLGCKFQSYGLGPGSMTIDKAEDAAKVQAIPSDVLEIGLRGLLETSIKDDPSTRGVGDRTGIGGIVEKRYGKGRLKKND